MWSYNSYCIFRNVLQVQSPNLSWLDVQHAHIQRLYGYIYKWTFDRVGRYKLLIIEFNIDFLAQSSSSETQACPQWSSQPQSTTPWCSTCWPASSGTWWRRWILSWGWATTGSCTPSGMRRQTSWWQLPIETISDQNIFSGWTLEQWDTV